MHSFLECLFQGQMAAWSLWSVCTCTPIKAYSCRSKLISNQVICAPESNKVSSLRPMCLHALYLSSYSWIEAIFVMRFDEYAMQYIWIHSLILQCTTWNNCMCTTRCGSSAPGPTANAQGYWRHSAGCAVRPWRGHRWSAVSGLRFWQRNRNWCNRWGLSGCFLQCYTNANDFFTASVFIYFKNFDVQKIHTFQKCQ